VPCCVCPVGERSEAQRAGGPGNETSRVGRWATRTPTRAGVSWSTSEAKFGRRSTETRPWARPGIRWGDELGRRRCALTAGLWRSKAGVFGRTRSTKARPRTTDAAIRTFVRPASAKDTRVATPARNNLEEFRESDTSGEPPRFPPRARLLLWWAWADKGTDPAVTEVNGDAATICGRSFFCACLRGRTSARTRAAGITSHLVPAAPPVTPLPHFTRTPNFSAILPAVPRRNMRASSQPAALAVRCRRAAREPRRAPRRDSRADAVARRALWARHDGSDAQRGANVEQFTHPRAGAPSPLHRPRETRTARAGALCTHSGSVMLSWRSR